MNIAEKLAEVKGRLASSGVENPKLDSELLVAHILDVERYRLIVDASAEFPADKSSDLEIIVKRRENREPVAYILGYKEFYSLEFSVNKSVLIPRPETELAVDLAIYYAPMDSSVLDLCTGSGAIAVALKHSRKDVKVYASDISDDALSVARTNAKNILGSEESVTFIKSDIYNSIPEGRFDLIVSNPPYVSRSVSDTLLPELQYEPEIALYAEDEGRYLIERIVSDSKKYLTEKGILILEIGHDQGEFLQKLGVTFGFKVSIMNDYAGKTRIAVLKLD